MGVESKARVWVWECGVKGLKKLVFIEFFLFSQNLTKEQADYCVRKMVPYVDPKTGERVAGTLDYSKFVHELFVN